MLNDIKHPQVPRWHLLKIKLIMWFGVKIVFLRVSLLLPFFSQPTAFSFFVFHLLLLLGTAYFMTVWECSPTKASLWQVLGHRKHLQLSCGLLCLELLVFYHISSVCFVAGEEMNGTCQRISVNLCYKVHETWLVVCDAGGSVIKTQKGFLAVPPSCTAALTHYPLFQAK